MKRWAWGIGLVLPVLAACGGGWSAVSFSPPTAIGPNSPQSAARSVAAEPAAARSIAALTAPTSLYVGNTGNDSITVYSSNASGNTKPLRVIAGSNTGISQPGQLSQDAAGNLFVANGNNAAHGNHPGVLVFAAGATGNVKPIRTIAGPLTGLHFVNAAAVDPKTGELIVADLETSGPYQVDISLVRFGAGAAGNVAPIARSSPDPLPAYQLAYDSTDTHVIEAHLGDPAGEATLLWGLDTYPKDFANGFPILDRPIYDIGFMGTIAVADDPTTKSYVELSGGMYRLAEDTNGVGPLYPGGTDLSPPPLSLVTSEKCGNQVAIGPQRQIFVVHAAATCAADAVFVYAASANGNAAPLRVLKGANTLLDAPLGIYVGV